MSAQLRKKLEGNVKNNYVRFKILTVDIITIFKDALIIFGIEIRFTFLLVKRLN